MSIISEIISLMNYRKNKKVKRLAYSVLTNLLCIDEMRKAFFQHKPLDVLAKLIGILTKTRSIEND